MKITNGRNVFEVTRGAFDNIYKKQGFVPFEETGDGSRESESEAETEELTDDESFIADITVKPIAQWTSDELKRYAALKGITAKGNQLRAAVQRELENGELENNDGH